MKSNEISQQLDSKVMGLSAVKEKEISEQGLSPLPFGYIGPDLENSVLSNAKNWEDNFLRFVDLTAADLDLFICGANLKDKHRISLSFLLNYQRI